MAPGPAALTYSTLTRQRPTTHESDHARSGETPAAQLIARAINITNRRLQLCSPLRSASARSQVGAPIDKLREDGAEWMKSAA